MGQIDVSELLVDPDFVEQTPVTVISRTSTVNNRGRNELAEVSRNVIAVVQPASGNTLKRLPDGAQLSRWCTVYTQQTLKEGGEGGYPDIVVWKGRRYQVQLVADYSNWGAGWTRADCELEGVES